MRPGGTLIAERCAPQECVSLRRSWPRWLSRGSGGVLHRGLWPALGLLGLILLLPLPAGLNAQGRAALAVLAFSLVLWLTEAVSPEVSAVLIAGLIAIVLGLTADPASPTGAALGTSKALGLAVQGFANPALALVAGPLFTTAAMGVTGLDRRIGLLVLSRIGSSSHSVLLGVLLVSALLSLFVPSSPARMATLVPLLLAMVAVFDLERQSRFGAIIMIAAAHSTSIWNIGIKTSASNAVALGFMEAMLGQNVTWLRWFAVGAPYAVAMSAILYGLLLWLMPPERKEAPGGEARIRQGLLALGPMTAAEKRLLVMVACTLALWVTEKTIHPVDSGTVAIGAVAALMMPRIGVIGWKEAQARVPWGTIALFGVGISLGTVLLRSQAASWVASRTLGAIGVGSLTPLLMLEALIAFGTIIRLGFTSATASASVLMPVLIGFLQAIHLPTDTVLSFVLLAQFTNNSGFILPVNASHNMIAYGTETFAARDFIRIGLLLAAASHLVMLLFAATYWHWLGLI